MLRKFEISRAVLAAALMSTAGVVSAHAQETGVIVGRVIDAASSQALAGALVRIDALGLEARTDANGQFRLVGAPAGDHTLSISFLGAAAASQAITAIGGQTVDILLPINAGGTDRITVTGRRSADQAALNTQRSADGISNIVAADTLGRFPDATAADSLRRLPGISFEREDRSGDGQFISIRGLDAALNNVQINGVNSAQANASGDRRVPLDVFQAESLSRIVVNKSLLPNNESDGIGGSIELEQQTPLQLGQDINRFSIDGRLQEVDEDLGFGLSGTYGRIFGETEQFGVLLSASYRKRNRTAFEIENIEMDPSNTPAPLYVPAANGINNGVPGSLGDPTTWPSTFPGLQYSWFDDDREDLSLSGVFDWQAASHTRFSLLGSLNIENDKSGRSTTRFGTGEPDDEDNDPDDDILPRLDTGVTVDLADLFPDLGLTPGQFIAVGGDEIFAVAEAEVRLRAESEPEENQNFTVAARGETILDRWTFKYQAGYAYAQDGFSDGPRAQIDFEPEDIETDDFVEFLEDNGLDGLGIGPADIWPGGFIIGDNILASNGATSDSSLPDGRYFWTFANIYNGGIPQLGRQIDRSAVQRLVLEPRAFLGDGVTLDYEYGEQTRWSGKFDATYEPDAPWIDFLAAGVKVETASRQSFDFEVADFDSDDFNDIFVDAGYDLDGNGDFTLAEANAAFGLTNGTWDLTRFGGVASIDQILRFNTDAVEAMEEVINAAEGPFDFPVSELDERFFTAYAMGKFNFGAERRWELIGGARFEYGEIETNSTQFVSIETIDTDALGNFLGELDASGNPNDGDDVFVNSADQVFLVSDGTLVGVRGDGPGELGVDFETTEDEFDTILEDKADFFEFLPRVQLNYRATDDLIFRSAYWTAIARPSFEDLSSAGEIEFQQSTEEPDEAEAEVQLGNPDLNNAFSQNFDLGVEYYFGDVGVVSINAFHKIIDDYIFVDATPTGETNLTTLPQFIIDQVPQLEALAPLLTSVTLEQPRNAWEAEITGVELAVQRRLDAWLPEALEGFGVFANITFQDSEARLVGTDVVTPFFKAPEQVGTLSVFYDNNGIDAALTYSFQSFQLDEYRDQPFTGSIFEDDYDQLDLSVKYDIPWDKIDARVSLNVQDILNSGDEPVDYRGYGENMALFDTAQFIGRTVTFGTQVRF